MAKTSCHVENFRGGFCHILPPYFVSPYFGSTTGHFGRKYGANMERFSLEIMGLKVELVKYLAIFSLYLSCRVTQKISTTTIIIKYVVSYLFSPKNNHGLQDEPHARWEVLPSRHPPLRTLSHRGILGGHATRGGWMAIL